MYYMLTYCAFIPSQFPRAAMLYVINMYNVHWGYLCSTGAANKQVAAAHAVSLGAASMLMSHLSRVTWQAKDVIWVVPDASCDTLTELQRWVHTYQLQVRNKGFYSRYACMQKLALGHDSMLVKLSGAV